MMARAATMFRPSRASVAFFFAALGTFVYGFDTGTIATTIGQKSWMDYMGHPTEGLTGAVISLFITGECVGGVLQIFLGDRLGRINFMALMCIIVTIGTSVQTASMGIGSFLAGRAIAGVAVGGLACTVPTYLSEIATNEHRGWIVSLTACGTVFGAMTSNWIGAGCAFLPYGQAQWRIPLGMQIPWSVIFFFGLITFMPESPRLLIRKGKIEDAMASLALLRRNVTPTERNEEFSRIRAQIEFEKNQPKRSMTEIFRRYRHRTLVAISVQVLIITCGITVIGYYQTILYRNLGLASHIIMILTGIYGTISFLSNAITLRWLFGRWGRRPILLAGLAGSSAVLIYVAVLQRVFTKTDNMVGKGFAVAGIYLYAIFFSAMLAPTSYIYSTEVLPIAIRSKVLGVALIARNIVSIAITEAGPKAFAILRENYYYVFVGCNTFFMFIVYFCFPETKHRSLEEVAEAFGDQLVNVSVRETEEFDGKNGEKTKHIRPVGSRPTSESKSRLEV